MIFYLRGRCISWRRGCALLKEAASTRLLPQMANRHGLIAGATGTGKTVTLRVIAENFSRIGVPVFMADVKSDLSGNRPGRSRESENSRATRQTRPERI